MITASFAEKIYPIPFFKLRLRSHCACMYMHAQSDLNHSLSLFSSSFLIHRGLLTVSIA